MGIRIEPVSVQQVVRQAPETARRLAGQLGTMPKAVAHYKELEEANHWIPGALHGALRDPA